MAESPTVDDILKTLTPTECEEVQRDDFIIPLQIYLKGINQYGSDKHREMAVRKLRIHARNRAAVRNEIAKNPEILKTPVKNPIIIIGLPRSGTTFLQRVLASDEQFLTPMAWELFHSTPPGRPDNWAESERFRRSLESDLFNTKGRDHIHNWRLHLPSECLMLFMQYFLDNVEPLVYEGTKEGRDFVYNCPEEHLKNAYEYHKMCYKSIFYGNLKPGKTLLMKSNLHLLYPDTLRETYSDAKFVFTYRNMNDMVASFCSKIQAMGYFGNDKESPMAAAQRGLEYIRLCSSRVVKALKAWPKDCYITIPYADLTADHMGTMKKIYSHFNLQLTPGAEEAMQRYLVDNPQNKHGKHEYSLEQFGITEEDLKNSLAEYLEFFKY